MSFSPTRRRLLKATPAAVVPAYIVSCSDDDPRVSGTSRDTGGVIDVPNTICDTTALPDMVGVPTMEEVRTFSGVTQGVIVGVDYASVTPGTNAPTTPDIPLLIRTRSDAIAAASEGDGSKDFPYIIRDRDWTGIADNSFSWIDTDATYCIDLINCNFGIPIVAPAQHIYCEISSFDRAAQTETSRLRVIQSTSITAGVTPLGSGQCHVMVRNGLCEIIAHKFNGGRFHPAQKTGGTGTKLSLTDCEFTGSWRGAIGYIANLATGGDIDLNRITYSSNQSSKDGLWLANDCYIYASQIDIASDIAILVFLRSTKSVATENYSLEKTFIDCHFVSRTRIPTARAPADSWAWQNMNFIHCDFFGSNDLQNAGQKLVSIGPTLPSVTGNSENLLFSWCRFRKRNIGDQVPYSAVSGGPFSIGDRLLGLSSAITGIIVDDDGGTLTVESTDGSFMDGEMLTDDHGAVATISGAVSRFQAPGNECMDLHVAKNCVIENCWTDEAGEDAYEFHLPRGGNIVRYCGGENVHNQMVDIYSNSPLAYASEVLVHDIWGKCGGEGLSIWNISNVEAFRILTDTSEPIKGAVAGMPGNGPHANVVIQTETYNGQPNGCYIHDEISPPSKSAGGVPVAELLIGGATVGGSNSIEEAYWQEEPDSSRDEIPVSEEPDSSRDEIPVSDDNC